MGAMNVAMTVISMILVDRAGRRTLHLAGMGGMWICSVLLVIMLVLVSFCCKVNVDKYLNIVSDLGR